jgi:hypothetical protein
MPITLKTTPGGSDSNAYCTLVEADAYHESVIDNTALASWTGATDDQQNRAIVQATRLIDELFEFDGECASVTQALQWPRIGLLTPAGDTIDETVIPQQLKDATAELARSLMAADRTAELSSDGIESLEVGEIEINFSQARPPRRKVLPDRVVEMIALWGSRKYSTCTVPLLRV